MMTLKEKVTSIDPACIIDYLPGGVFGCPSNYGYLPEGMDYCVNHDPNIACKGCWNQEIPDKDDDYTYIALLKKRIDLLKVKNEAMKAAVREEFTASDYHEAALRTASDKCRSLANCAMGLAGEAGECVDIIKKHLFHDHDLDKEHLAKELGDVAWYIAVCAEVIGYNLEDILKMNIEKLKARYPDGFDSEKSKNRAEDDI